MLSTKNPFAASTTEGPEMPAASNDPGKALKRWQLEAGRTSKRIEDLDSQLATAVSACEQARYTYGARVESEEDSTDALATLTQAEGHIRACEAALTVAMEKDHAAQTELLLAERQASIEKEVVALTNLFAMGQEGEDIINRVEQFAVKLKTALENAHSAGAGGKYNTLASAPQVLALFIGRAMHVVTGTGFVPDRLMPHERWSDCLPDPETARTRRRS